MSKANAHEINQANQSICSQIIDQKQSGLPTDRPTDNQQNNIPPFLQKGGKIKGNHLENKNLKILKNSSYKLV